MKRQLLKTLLIHCLFAVSSLTFVVNAQPKNLPPDREPGKCYAKSLVSDLYEKSEFAVAIYYGDDLEIIDKYVKDTTFIVREEAEPITFTIKGYLTNTEVTKDYELEYFFTEKLIERRDQIEWNEVLCNWKITKDLVREIRFALGLEDVYPSKELGSDLKAELTNYQKLNYLPIGNLDAKTLEHLGIEEW